MKGEVLNEVAEACLMIFSEEIRLEEIRFAKKASSIAGRSL